MLGADFEHWEKGATMATLRLGLTKRGPQEGHQYGFGEFSDRWATESVVDALGRMLEALAPRFYGQQVPLW